MLSSEDKIRWRAIASRLEAIATSNKNLLVSVCLWITVVSVFQAIVAPNFMGLAKAAGIRLTHKKQSVEVKLDEDRAGTEVLVMSCGSFLSQQVKVPLGFQCAVWQELFSPLDMAGSSSVLLAGDL